MTERLYTKDVYARAAQMELLELRDTKNGTEARFKQTLFFPTGGGQPCDRGSIAGHAVLDVHEDKESKEVWHLLEGDCSDLTPGSVCAAELDWERRFRHMQLHAGEHLISGAFYKLFNAGNKGFHMGEDYVTIDIDLPEISPEMRAEAERFSNQAIWDNLPIRTIFFDTPEEAMSLPVRKAIKADEDISVVIFGDEENPTDCCACCGTHPHFAGEIGLIKITHEEKYKGMVRYYVKCGSPAYEEFCKDQEICTALGRKYSCDPQDLEKALAAAEERSSALARKYSALKAQIMKEAAEDLEKALAEPCQKSLLIRYYPQLSADDLQSLVGKLEAEIKLPLALVAEESSTVILASSGSPDCGKLVKENAGIYKGKGGGRPTLARAVFGGREDLELYLDLIEKHLR